MNGETTDKPAARARIQRLFDEASPEARSVIREVLQLERAFLYQRHRNKAQLGREIAKSVRRVVT
jgi:hypothetical protein